MCKATGLCVFTMIGLRTLPVRVQTTRGPFDMQAWRAVKSKSRFLEFAQNVSPLYCDYVGIDVASETGGFRGLWLYFDLISYQ